MKVKELRGILGAESVVISNENINEIFHINEDNEDNDYVNANLNYTNNDDMFISMWDLYGECEISQIFDDSDGLNIELK